MADTQEPEDDTPPADVAGDTTDQVADADDGQGDGRDDGDTVGDHNLLMGINREVGDIYERIDGIANALAPDQLAAALTSDSTFMDTVRGLVPTPQSVGQTFVDSPGFHNSVADSVAEAIRTEVAAELKADLGFRDSLKGDPGRNAPLGWLYAAFGVAALALILAIDALWYAKIVANAAMETTTIAPAPTITIDEVTPIVPAPTTTTDDSALARYRQGQ